MGDHSADPRAPENQRSCLDVIREVVEERVLRMQFKKTKRLELETVVGSSVAAGSMRHFRTAAPTLWKLLFALRDLQPLSARLIVVLTLKQDGPNFDCIEGRP